MDDSFVAVGVGEWVLMRGMRLFAYLIACLFIDLLS